MAMEEGLFYWTELLGKDISDRSLLGEEDMKSRVQGSWWANVQWQIIS